ncbi:MAG TPA: methyltransferase domain-containing protein, partial [Anaerolineae bacterium]|nr:methyltransferase domain-containing protein [Anaerolineae bacterium]
LTLGRLAPLQTQIVDHLVRDGIRVLEIGCGTGGLTLAMAKTGATVTAIDIAPDMLAEAERRIQRDGLTEKVKLSLMNAVMVGKRFNEGSFDLVVSSLCFSEMTPETRAYVLKVCLPLLAPGGKLAILDEVEPRSLMARWVYTAIRLPLRFLTWLLTRTTTHPLRDFVFSLSQAGYTAEVVASSLGGSLQLIIACPSVETSVETLPSTVRGRFQHYTSLRTILIDLWATFFRILPPYPKIAPDLYAVGRPDPESPVLVTGNFDLTIRRLVQAIDGKVNAWVLVVDSAGINVWCAAGGGFLNAEKVIGALRVSELGEIVPHRDLILPQLCANGVDGWRIRKETGWDVHWGPVRAEDLPEYLAAGKVKTEAMRWVRFPLKDRLEMVTVTLGFYGLMILVPIAIFWRPLFWSIFFSLVGLSYFYAAIHPWLPGRDGLLKSVPLALIALAGLAVYIVIWDPLPWPRILNWSLGLIGLSVFTAAELQGMSPLMRGEQANWGWEVIIGLGIGLTYWLLPLVLGWR